LQFLKSGLGGQDINFPTNYKESLNANNYIVPGSATSATAFTAPTLEKNPQLICDCLLRVGGGF
jgi:hypothetical protein